MAFPITTCLSKVTEIGISAEIHSDYPGRRPEGSRTSVSDRCAGINTSHVRVLGLLNQHSKRWFFIRCYDRYFVSFCTTDFRT